MSDAKKLELAREIYPDSKRARKESFTATQWAGVERAWAWVDKHYYRKLHDANGEPIEGSFLTPEEIARINVEDMTKRSRVLVPDMSKQTLVHLDACVLCGGAPGVSQSTCPASIHQPKEPTVLNTPAPSPAPAGVPTPVSCPCSKCGHGRHEHDRYGSCLASGSGHGGFCACGRYEDKDGASVPGDSGLNAGYNMERGSGCPASDHHADRETSTPYAPKEQAPSTICGVAPWPDRIELARRVRKTRFDYVNERDWHGEPASVDFMLADAALAVFQPALRTRDERIAELERRLAERCDQVDALQHERDKVMARLGNACQPYEIEDRIRGLQMRAGERDVLRQHLDASRALVKEHAATIATLTKERDDLNASVRRLAVDFDGMVTDRDAALARVAELEQEEHHHGVRLKCALDRVDELEKRGAVDVEACAREISELCRNTPLVRTWPNIVNIEAVLRKHSRDVRRITREEAISLAVELMLPDKEIVDALRAIGFEVEA